MLPSAGKQMLMILLIIIARDILEYNLNIMLRPWARHNRNWKVYVCVEKWGEGQSAAVA